MEYLEKALQILEFSKVWIWPVVIVMSFVLTALMKLGLKLMAPKIKKATSSNLAFWPKVFVELVDHLKIWTIFAWVFYLLAELATKSESPSKILKYAVVAISVYQVAVWGLHIIKQWKENILKEKIGADGSSVAAIGLMYAAIQGAFIIIVVLIGLSNLGVDIAALIAGLGVGGIAVALAAQNILGDLLASLSIVLDKPFVIGDFISVGTDRGTVVQIGIKTTRLKTTTGDELIFSNKDLLESRVYNFKSNWRRRIIHKFGVTYSTPPEKLELISDWVRELTEQYPILKFERCHFNSFGASSLDFELCFWVEESYVPQYLDFQQGLLLDILRKFNQEKIDFAFPTQSVLIEKLPV